MIAKVLLTSTGLVVYFFPSGGEATHEERQVAEELERRIRALSDSLDRLTAASLMPEMRSSAAVWQCFVRVADKRRREEVITLLRESGVSELTVGHLWALPKRARESPISRPPAPSGRVLFMRDYPFKISPSML